MIGEVRDGIMDTSTAGFSITPGRAEIVNFSPVVFPTFTSLFIQRPNDNDAGTHYHTLEFTQEAWIFIGSSYVVMWIVMIIFVFRANKKLNWSIKVSLGICLRAYVNKVSY